MKYDPNFEYDPMVKWFDRASNLTRADIPVNKFVGNFEWRDTLVTFALLELEDYERTWLAECPFKPIDVSAGQVIFRYVTEVTRATGLVLVELSTGRAAHPIFEGEYSDVIIGWKRLRKLKFINLVEV